MKIIFGSEDEREEVINVLADSNLCPTAIGLKSNCSIGSCACEICWNIALEAVEKKEG